MVVKHTNFPDVSEKGCKTGRIPSVITFTKLMRSLHGSDKQIGAIFITSSSAIHHKQQLIC